MRILCTFPGRYGDLFWALPTIRALSRRVGQPIDLQIAGEFANVLPLLRQQPYLGMLYADDGWSMAQADERPTVMAGPQDVVFYLSYMGWPQRPLPFHVLDTLNRYSAHGFTDADLHLDEPWIQIDGPGPPTELAVGFTEAWFELKFGLMCSLERHLPPYLVLTPPGSRWTKEGAGLVAVQAEDWITHARTIRNADFFLGDCSALHVLAVAMGRPVLLMEPMEGRWNDIFYPLGKTGPQVTLITGNDGKPTFDAHHVRDAIDLHFSRASARTS